jgi:hypothetical protein
LNGLHFAAESFSDMARREPFDFIPLLAGALSEKRSAE